MMEIEQQLAELRHAVAVLDRRLPVEELPPSPDPIDLIRRPLAIVPGEGMAGVRMPGHASMMVDERYQPEGAYESESLNFLAGGYAHPTAAFSSGATLDLDPCDIAGTDNEEVNMLGVYVQADQSSLDLQSITLNGSARTPDCTLATTATVRYTIGDDGEWYLIGEAGWALRDWIVDATNSMIQTKIQWRVGGALSTLSAEFDVHQGDDCDDSTDAQIWFWVG